MNGMPATQQSKPSKKDLSGKFAHIAAKLHGKKDQTPEDPTEVQNYADTLAESADELQQDLCASAAHGCMVISLLTCVLDGG